MSNGLFSLSFTGAALMLVWGPKKLILWPMKLRLDLLEHLTDEDILEEVLANNHRYKPEPHFSKTGVGSLSSASTEQRAKEEERSMALIERVMKRSRKNGAAAKRKRVR
jgi:hypothetical protein